LAAAENFGDFFYRLFEHPLLRNAQKRDKIKPSKTTGAWGGGGGREEKKPHVGDGPRWDVLGKVFFRVFLLPLLRNAQKTRLKKSRKTVKNKIIITTGYFVFGAVANVRQFRHFLFSRRPLKTPQRFWRNSMSKTFCDFFFLRG
jgi:hypothetical protein